MNNRAGSVGFVIFTAVTMKNAVFWDIKTQFVPHRKHITSTLELSRLIPCKICGFHGGGYEKCRILGYKNPDPTSEETYHFYARAQPVKSM
jgi:hypothetical protein